MSQRNRPLVLDCWLPTAVLLALWCFSGWPAVPAEATTGHSIDQKKVCLECHDLESDLQARVQHAPVAAGDCSSCHNPHVARFAGLLLQQPGPLCAGCHAELSALKDKASVHPPAADGRCADCHQPHGSDHAGLLKAAGSALCSTCHSQIADWQTRSVQHVPFAQGRCGTCHEPHASDVEGLMTAASARVCTSCHAQGDAFRTAHGGYPVERAACQTCHDPHASDKRGLFREKVHAPFATGRCQTCHAGPGSSTPFAVTKSEAELCGSCHSAQVTESKQAPFPHVSAGGGRCTSCHNPHAGSGDGMLIKESNQTCLSCHNPGGSKSGLEGRYSTHAEDLECTSCHSPHGGNQPMLLTEEPLELCGGCHSHEHGARHPVGEDIFDPRTGSVMDCGSCHGIHLAPYDKYLHAADSGDLCVGCHREIGGIRR